MHVLIYFCFKFVFIILSSATILEDVHVCIMSGSLQGKRSLLHTAAEKGHVDILNILIKHGADVDTKDNVRNL